MYVESSIPLARLIIGRPPFSYRNLDLNLLKVWLEALARKFNKRSKKNCKAMRELEFYLGRSPACEIGGLNRITKAGLELL